MDFFTKEDFDNIMRFEGQRMDPNNPNHKKTYNELRKSYEKVKYWGETIKNELFPNGSIAIIKKPTNQANNFERYQWCKIYPDKNSPVQLAYTIEFNADATFIVKIDTVKLGDVDEKRIKYLNYRGDWNTSKIVLQISFNDKEKNDWSILLKKTKEFILSTKSDYDTLTKFFTVEKPSGTNVFREEIFPLNQILYGPPGTGKTHYITSEILSKYKLSSQSKSKEEFEAENISKLPWWKVIAITLLKEKELTVPLLKAHKFIKYKLAVSNTDSLDQTMWGQLSSHTIVESTTVAYSTRSKVLVFDKKESDSIWFIVENKKSLLFDLSELLNEIESYQPISIDKDNFKFITFHQSFSYEDFIEGIKPKLNEEDNVDNVELSYIISKGIFYNACEEAAKLAGFISLKECLQHSKEERIEKFKEAPSFAILIDEINRGNISAIFGELITLIEPEKRLTKDEIIVELPYSRNKFSVPPNLHIYGTMNTADRSVESLDTALRRRFSFVEMLPDPKLLKNKEINGINLQVLLERINERIEVLVDRDHTIGHYYLMKIENLETLRLCFQNKIIPLLQEYFYGNYAKMELIIGEAFFKKIESKGIKFAFKSSMDFEENQIYHLLDVSKKDVMNDEAFIKALTIIIDGIV